MLRSFIAWLDDYLAGEGPSALVKAVVGLLSFAGLLGAVLGDVAIKAGALVVVILSVVSLGLMIVADRKRLRRRIELAERVIVRCADFTHALEPGYRMTAWDKTVVVSPNGDAAETLKVRAAVERPDVQFFWLRTGCGWPQPAKYRRRVDVRVRNLLTSDVPGTSLDRTLSWRADGRLVVVIHLPRPPRVGGEICILMETWWPGKCAPLMRDGRCDEFTIRLDRVVEHARYRIVLPKGYGTYCEPIGFQSGDSGFSVVSATTDEGCSAYQLEARDLPVDRNVGLRLELKQGAPVTIR
jgi:hypothetical protein